MIVDANRRGDPPTAKWQVELKFLCGLHEPSISNLTNSGPGCVSPLCGVST